jgi:uncharacterized iron-regulated membrane protein
MHSMFGGGGLPPQNQHVEIMEGAPVIGANEAVAIALAERPGSRLVGLFFPAEAEDAMRATVMPLDAVKGTPAISVAINPYMSEVVSVRDPSSGGFGNAFMAWQRPLHDGQGLGPIWKFLVFASGLLPVLFTVTGTVMWWIKRRNRITMKGQKQAALQGAAAE